VFLFIYFGCFICGLCIITFWLVMVMFILGGLVIVFDII